MKYKIMFFVVLIFLLSVLLGLSIRSNSKVKSVNNNLITPITPSPTIFEYIVISETPVPTPTKTPTPTPRPSPTPIKIPLGNLEELFTKYAREQSVDRDLLKKIAWCESHFNPAANNPPYGGMFQFSSNSWISTRMMMNLDTNPDLRFNPEEAIKTAAFKLAIGGKQSWPNCSK